MRDVLSTASLCLSITATHTLTHMYTHTHTYTQQYWQLVRDWLLWIPTSAFFCLYFLLNSHCAVQVCMCVCMHLLYVYTLSSSDVKDQWAQTSAVCVYLCVHVSIRVCVSIYNLGVERTYSVCVSVCVSVCSPSVTGCGVLFHLKLFMLPG